ncbi:hypothetical protein DPX16_22217 [Anabarilius grahami]|uniref:Uncharacterized protein n=1 Tax=Anabarilius grahami TaxID=495550 RepID=A0A3N0XNP1_ANAGA|nr:hypothetical protein DPX16_22217 [Anabarilius grahami]
MRSEEGTEKENTHDNTGANREKDFPEGHIHLGSTPAGLPYLLGFDFVLILIDFSQLMDVDTGVVVLLCVLSI